MNVVLASKSPRRKELMRLLTETFTVAEPAVDEAAHAAQSPMGTAKAVAHAKAAQISGIVPDALVIGCDTVVALGAETLGKPRDEDDARAMLTRLSCRRHQVHTGVSLFFPDGTHTDFCETTQVNFATIPFAEVERTLKTPEPYDKAGAYGIQGWAARFVTSIDGCYYNVMGLPVSAIYLALADRGIFL